MATGESLAAYHAVIDRTVEIDAAIFGFAEVGLLRDPADLAVPAFDP